MGRRGQICVGIALAFAVPCLLSPLAALLPEAPDPDNQYGPGSELGPVGGFLVGLVVLTAPAALIIVRRTRWVGIGWVLTYLVALLAILVVGLFFWVIYNA